MVVNIAANTVVFTRGVSTRRRLIAKRAKLKTDWVARAGETHRLVVTLGAILTWFERRAKLVVEKVKLYEIIALEIVFR